MSAVLEGGFRERLSLLRGAARIVVETLQNNRSFVATDEKQSLSREALQTFIDLAQECLGGVAYDKCRANLRRKIMHCLKKGSGWHTIESLLADMQVLATKQGPAEKKETFIAFFIHLQYLLDKAFYYQENKGE